MTTAIINTRKSYRALVAIVVGLVAVAAFVTFALASTAGGTHKAPASISTPRQNDCLYTARFERC